MSAARVLAIVSVLALAGLALFTRRGSAMADETASPVGPPATPYDGIFKRYAVMTGLDWRLIRAVATVESSLNPIAINRADNESLGLMQVLCRPDGKGGCTNHLPAVRGWTTATRDYLLDPDFNVYIGAQILADNFRAYGSIQKAVAVYNAWDQRNASKSGPFKNQAYVDKVLRVYRELGGTV